MTKDELETIIELYKIGRWSMDGVMTAIDGYTKDLLQPTEPTTTDEAGHHSEWKFCPGCGFDWDIEMGADQFGCWNCGFIRKQQ